MTMRTRSHRVAAHESGPTVLPTQVTQPVPCRSSLRPPRSFDGRHLITLPADILLEILGYVLDGPNDAFRPAVLRVSSLLCELGTPLLFRHVRVATIASWEAMFGPTGFLATLEAGGKGYGSRVRTLELDRTGEPEDRDWSFPVSASLDTPSLHTLILSDHLVETWTTYPDRQLGNTDPRVPIFAFNHHHCVPVSLFTSIFTQMSSITTLVYTPTQSYLKFSNPPSSGRQQGDRRDAISTLLGFTGAYDRFSWPLTSPTALDPSPWPNLRTVIYRGGLVLDDPRGVESNVGRAMAFSMLPGVERLVIEFARDEKSPGWGMQSIFQSFLWGSVEEEKWTRWRGVERIEIRRIGNGAKLMEKRLRALWAKTFVEPAPDPHRQRWDEIWSKDRRRIANKVVFVDADGTERRLVDDC